MLTQKRTAPPQLCRGDHGSLGLVTFLNHVATTFERCVAQVQDTDPAIVEELRCTPTWIDSVVPVTVADADQWNGQQLVLQRSSSGGITVPEPKSGVLVLIGLALLPLTRRR